MSLIKYYIEVARNQVLVSVVSIILVLYLYKFCVTLFPSLIPRWLVFYVCIDIVIFRWLAFTLCSAVMYLFMCTAESTQQKQHPVVLTRGWDLALYSGSSTENRGGSLEDLITCLMT